MAEQLMTALDSADDAACIAATLGQAWIDLDGVSKRVDGPNLAGWLQTQITVLPGMTGSITWDNAARIEKVPGSNGVQLVCTIDYVHRWKDGKLYIMQQDGTTIRAVMYGLTTPPDANFDSTLGYVVGNLLTLDNGNIYICTDATAATAVWRKVIDLSSRLLADASDVTSVDWYGRTLLDSYNVISADWNNRHLRGPGNVTSVDWYGRQLIDASNVTSVDWYGRQLIDASNVPSLDWNSRVLNDSSAIISADWGSRYLADPAEVTSIDWASRVLRDSIGTVTVSWENKVLTGNWKNEDGLGLSAVVIGDSPATAFTITSDINSRDTTNYLTPAGTLAAGTFSLPADADSAIGQIVRIFSTEIITALTVGVASSGTLKGATVSTLAANTGAAWQKVSSSGNGTWIRIA